MGAHWHDGLGPRERLQLRGASSLSDAELLAVLLGTGTRAEPVEVLATRVLRESGGLAGLAHCQASWLCHRAGVGLGKAARICAAIELGVRVQSRPFRPQQAIRSSSDVAEAVRPRLQGEVREYFLALALNARHRPLALLDVAVGGLAQCGFTPGDAFRGALRHAAQAVVFVHNHPSGDVAPSVEDRQVTEHLCQVGELLGIVVLDHIIVASAGYFSFADAGWMPQVPGPMTAGRTAGWPALGAGRPSRGASSAAARPDGPETQGVGRSREPG